MKGINAWNMQGKIKIEPIHKLIIVFILFLTAMVLIIIAKAF